MSRTDLATALGQYLLSELERKNRHKLTDTELNEIPEKLGINLCPHGKLSYEWCFGCDWEP